MAAAKKAKAKSAGTIELKRLTEVRLSIPIVGLTPLISHKWSEKAKRMMPGHPESDNVKEDKGKHEPEAEAEACLYRLSDGRPGHPSTGFKAAIVGSCRLFDKPDMVTCKTLVFVEGEGPDQLVPIECEEMVLREDQARTSGIGSNAYLLYRYMMVGWRTRLIVRFVPTVISAESVVSLVDAAGRGGVGDWRPSAPKSFSGTFGTWRVADDEDIEMLGGGK